MLKSVEKCEKVGECVSGRQPLQEFLTIVNQLVIKKSADSDSYNIINHSDMQPF